MITPGPGYMIDPQNANGVIPDPSAAPANAITPPSLPTSTPSIISSKVGADIVDQKTQTLNKLSPPPVTTTPITPATGTSTGGTTVNGESLKDMSIRLANGQSGGGNNPPAPTPTSVTLINPNTEQTVTFNDASLNKDNIQSYLSSGYAVSEASGNLPDWLSPNGVSTDQTPEQKAQAEADAASADLKTLSTNLSQYTISDADLQQQISGITSLWNAREADMQKVNDQRIGSLNTLGVRLGSRYAGGSGGAFGGIVSEEERQGVQRIADLEGQKQAAITAAKTAAMTQNWSVYSKQIDMAESAYTQKVAAVKDLQDAAVAQNKLIADQIQQQKTDNYNQVIKPQQDILTQASANGAPTDVIKGIQSVIDSGGTLGDAISAAGNYLQTGTGALGDYLQYKRDAVAKGLTPLDFTGYTDQQTAKASQAKIQEAYATESAKNAADANSTQSDKVQQKLEQEYRQVLSKEFSARTGSLGIENSKVNQANHLNSLFQQYYDPKTGNYNIPTAQYAELAIGLANMISPSGQSSDSDRAEIKSKTAAGDLKGALQYITGIPENGNTQAIIKNLVDSVDRQAETAIRNRQAALEDMKAQAPTDLAPDRVAALNQSTQMVGYEGQDRISKTVVNDYVKSHPDEAESIAKLYEVPGATDQDIEEYLKAQGKI